MAGNKGYPTRVSVIFVAQDSPAIQGHDESKISFKVENILLVLYYKSNAH